MASGRDRPPHACHYATHIDPNQPSLTPFRRFSDFIAKHHRLSEAEARIKFWQIISAIEYCHNLNIVHRDLKVS